MEIRETIKNPKSATLAFEEYRQKAFFKQELIGFPKKVIMPFSSTQDLEKIYSVAEKVWTENFKISEFKTNLNLYKENSSQQLKAYFKKTRKNGLILKSAYRFADLQRFLPEEYDNLVRSLGGFNDHRDNLPSQTVDGMYGDMTRLTIKPERHGTTPLTEASKRVKWICDNVKRLLTSENSSISEKENFHKVRKLTRHLMNLYQLIGFINKREEYTDNFIFLHKIVDSMGVQLDANKGAYLVKNETKQNLISFMNQLSVLASK